MTVSITLTFTSFEAAADALHLLGQPRPSPTIAHEDRPDVGAAETLPVVVPATTFNPFAARVESVTAVAAVPIDAGAAVVLVPPPPVVPTPPVVIPPPTAAIAPTAALDVDVHGLPWDQRIHADAGKGKPHPKIGDGSWRKKRGVDDVLVATVEAELRAALGAKPPPLPTLSAAAMVPGGAAAPVVPTVPVLPVTLSPVPSPATSAAVPVPPPITAPSPAAPSVPAPDAAPLTFASLMARIAPPITKNPDAAAIALAILAPYGLTAYGQLPTVLQNDPPLFARIAGELTAALGVA